MTDLFTQRLDALKEAIEIVELFLAQYETDTPEEFENPQDMLNHVLAVLKEWR